MSGHIMRLNPSTRTYVRQGADGRFAPKVMGQNMKAQPIIQKYPALPDSPLKVLSQRPPTTS